MVAFRQGLRETGYIEGQNAAIEYRWADGQYERLPELAADLINRQAVVIFAAGSVAPARSYHAAASLPRQDFLAQRVVLEHDRVAHVLCVVAVARRSPCLRVF
jgi:uridylate kinase